MSFDTLFANQVPDFLQQNDVVVLDHRDARSYNNGHLPGAQPVTDALIMQLMKSKQAAILIYCYHGHSSKDLATMLVNLGCEKVYNLEGGWQAWSVFQQNQLVESSDILGIWMKDFGFDRTNLNSRIENGMSALMQAAYLAEQTLVDELLVKGVDINLVNHDENNALWFACVSEDIKIIKQLIANGIDIDKQNVNGATSLIYAASAGKYTIVEELIKAGANIHLTTLDGFSALDSATTIEILKFLKSQYAAA